MLAISDPWAPRIASKNWASPGSYEKHAGSINRLARLASLARIRDIFRSTGSPPVGASLLAINDPSMPQTHGRFNRRSLRGAATDEGHHGREGAAGGDGQR